MKRFMVLFALMLVCGLALLPACSTVQDDQAAATAQSDKDIESDIRNRLRQDSMTDRYPLGVASEEGVVTLTGFVGGEAAAMRAVSVARGADGVKGVIDNLTR